MGRFITPLASLLSLILRFPHPPSSIYLNLTSCFPFLRSLSLLPAAFSDYSALLPGMYVSLLVPLPPPLSISHLAPSRGTDPSRHRSHISKSLCHHVSAVAVLNVASGAGDVDYTYCLYCKQLNVSTCSFHGVFVLICLFACLCVHHPFDVLFILLLRLGYNRVSVTAAHVAILTLGPS